MSRLVPAVPLDEILEKDWMRTVTDLAQQLGWLTYHVFNSRRSTHGFPDLVLVRDRVVYLELKREDRKSSKATEEQLRWLRKLRDAGAEVYLVRPSHLDELARILAARRLEFANPLSDELDAELGRRTA
jgi:hypothetical protein